MMGAGKAKGLAEPVRLARLLGFISAAVRADHLETPPNFGFRRLAASPNGTYGMTVTRNWRLTFTLPDEQTLADLT